MCSIGSVISEKLLNKLTDKHTFYSSDTKIDKKISMVRLFRLNYWINRQTFYYFDTKRTSTLLKSLSERQFIIGKPLAETIPNWYWWLTQITIQQCLSYSLFFLSHMWIFLDDEHRISIEGKSPYEESYTFDSHWKMFGNMIQPNVA